MSAFDFVVYVRSGIYFVVEHYCHLLAYVLAGDAGPVAGAFGVHAHGYLVAAQGVEVAVCVAYGLAVEGCLAAGGAEGVESGSEVVRLSVLVGAHGGFDSPAQTKVGGKYVLCHGRCEHGVDCGHGLGIGCVAHGGAVACALADECHQGRCVHGGVGGEGVCEGVDGVGDFLYAVCFIKFEVCRALEKVANAFVVFHAGKLEEDLSVLAFEHLNVGRNNAELVDTVAEHVGSGVVHAVFHLLFKSGAYSVVAHTRVDNALENH